MNSKHPSRQLARASTEEPAAPRRGPGPGPGPSAGPDPDSEHQPMASQWAAIRSLRGETAFHHERFRQLCRDLQDPTVSKLLDLYPDAQRIRQKGAQLVKDVLEGFQPKELSLVFAFTSFSYAISQLLFKNGRLERSEILADLGAWRGMIRDTAELQAFDLIAQSLWPEAMDHYSRLNFAPAPVPSSVPAAVWSRDVPFHGRELSSSTVRLAEPTTPDLPYFAALGQDAIDSSNFPSRCQTGSPFDFGSLPLQTGLEGAIDRDMPIVGDHADSLMNLSNDTFCFAALGHLSNEFPPQGPFPSSACLQAESLNDAGSNDHHLPGGPTLDALDIGREHSMVVMPEEKKVEPHEAGMFFVVFIFLQDVAQLVYILSGRNNTPPSRRHKLYKVEERAHEAFYEFAVESLFRPLRHCQDLKAPACLALLLVAERVTKDGLLRTIPEIKHYLSGVALVSL